MTHTEAQKRHTKLLAEIRKYESASDKDFLFSVSDRDVNRLKKELQELEKLFPSLVSQKHATPKKSEALTEEIKKLRSKIEHHNRLYYEKGTPEISDFDFDQLVKRLEKLEKRSETKKPRIRRVPVLPLADSPTQHVGGAPSEKFARVKHLVPMLSLDKVEASDHPTKDEEPDREKRNRAQDENTLAELRTWDATLRKQLGRDQSNTSWNRRWTACPSVFITGMAN